MRITFLGHAAFLLETAEKRIITDPYSRDIGYLAVDERADFVTISHHNPKWHSCLDDVAGDFEMIDGLQILDGGAARGEIQFGSVRVFETPSEGENAMVWMESEGVRVLHTGDCGVLPDDETLEKCGRVDVLLALAGGSPTLELDDLMILIQKLAPKIVIPMHFGVPGLQMKALGVEAIEARFETHQIVRHPNSTLHFLWDSLDSLWNSDSQSAIPQKMKQADSSKLQLHILAPLRAQDAISIQNQAMPSAR